jgi:DNA-3-methyladenine glycosylase
MEERGKVAGAARGVLLPRAFFEAPPEQVAPRLLGKVLARRIGLAWVSGRIVEVEAYLGPHNTTPDPAAHSYRGLTERNRVLFGPAGHAYIYSIYGMHFCMNITCEIVGRAGCVLLRALEPLAGLEAMARNRGLTPETGEREIACGPGRLCQALALARSENGLDLLDEGSPLQVRDDGFAVHEALVTRRIGIRQAAELMLRFALPGHACVSGPKYLEGERVRIA